MALTGTVDHIVMQIIEQKEEEKSLTHLHCLQAHCSQLGSREPTAGW